MRKFFGLLLVLLLLTTSVAFADPAMEIPSIDVQMEVDLSNTYHITETIKVNFLQERRGMIRDIPRKFYGYNHDIEDLSITDEKGNPHPFSTTNHGDVLEIRIGDANTFLTGPVTYVIKYTFVMGADRNPEFDQVYWDLIGNEWTSTIEEMTFRVTMPKAFDETTLNVPMGSYGSIEKAQWQVNGNTVTGTAGRPLRAYESLTFRLDMAEGYFTEAPLPYDRNQFFATFGVLGAAILAGLGIRKKNEANNEIIPVVSFDPPYDLNPPEIGYMNSEEIISSQDMATLITYWASKGYLRIVEEDKSNFLGGSSSTMTFIQQTHGDEIRNDYERTLFQRMFSYGSDNQVKMSQLEHKFYKDVDHAMGRLKQRFTGDQEILVNSYQYLPGILILIVFVAATWFIGGQLEWLLGIPSFMGYIITVVILGIILVVATVTNKDRGSKTALSGCLGTLFVPLAFMGVYLFMRGSFRFDRIFSGFSLPRLSEPWLWYVIATIALTGFLFYNLVRIKKYTPYAREHLGQIRGFKDFLEKAKTEELNMMFQNNPNYYYDMLPFVYVFGLTDIWEDHLKRLTLPAPDWYQSDRPFYPGRFYVNLNSNFGQATSPPPQQSSSGGGGSRGGFGGGFGGGGFSGGGGGGGGGRSW